MSKGRLQTYDEAAIRGRLVGNLRHWSYDGTSITRTYRTGSWKVTLMVVNAIGHLAEAAWHHPELRVTFPSVEVRLDTHDAGGITERDFELAENIEAFVLWTPSSTSALEGAPSDPALAYLTKDD